MQKKIVISLVLFFIFSCTPINDQIIFNNEWGEKKVEKKIKKKVHKKINTRLIVDKFNMPLNNLLKGTVNVWDNDPDDDSNGCIVTYNKKIKIGEKGCSLQINYDVDSASQSYNGIYEQLKGINISSYNNLVFHVKGDGKKGFTSLFKVELKNNFNQAGWYNVKGITEKWQKIIIPLDKMKGITDFTSMKEFTIVFEDIAATKKVGTLYIDDLYFSK